MQLFLHQKNWKFPWSSWETPELRRQLLDTSSCDGALIWTNGWWNTARVCCIFSKKSCDSCSKSIKTYSSYNLWTIWYLSHPIPNICTLRASAGREVSLRGFPKIPILVSFVLVDFVYTLPSGSDWYEEISYKYIYLLRRFHQFLVCVFILCMYILYIPAIVMLLWHCHSNLPPKKNLPRFFRLWEGTNGGGDPGDCGLLSCKWGKSIFRPRGGCLNEATWSFQRMMVNVAGCLSWKENV